MADEKKEEVVQENAAPAQTEEKGGKPEGSKTSLIIIVAVAVLVVVVTPLSTYLVIKNMAPVAIVDVENDVKAGKEIVIPMDAITVNIAETKGTRILRIEPHLVVSDQKLADDLKDSAKAMLVDRVILAASRKTIDELEGPNGREGLKRDIMGEINAVVRARMAGSVTDVYFKEFLIQ